MLRSACRWASEPGARSASSSTESCSAPSTLALPLGDRLAQLQKVVSGHLRIATVHSIGLHELPRNLKLFKKAFPAIEVQVEYLRSAQVYQHVAEGAADLGFVAYPTRHRGVVIESSWKDKLVLICPPTHPLADRQSVPITALEGEKFISFSFDLPTRKAIDRIFKAHTVSIRRSMEFDNIETVKRAVEIEDGISIVPLNAIEEERQIGSIVAVEIESVDTWRPIGLVQRRARRQAPAGAARAGERAAAALRSPGRRTRRTSRWKATLGTVSGSKRRPATPAGRANRPSLKQPVLSRHRCRQSSKHRRSPAKLDRARR